MKNLKYFFLASLFVLNIACSSDDDNGNSNSIPGNNLSLGRSAHDLLANDTFNNMEVEIVYPEGFAPETNSLIQLKNFLELHTYKTNITFIHRQIATPNGAPYTIDEIRTIEENNRTSFNTENTISVFIFFANSDREDTEEGKITLGTAYQNTSMVIFEKTIQGHTQGFGPQYKSSIEITTLTHEFGHLFGLVDIGTEMQTNHLDPDAEGHCDVDGCLMQAQLEFSSGITGMLGDGIPNLGPQCIADLQANGGR